MATTYTIDERRAIDLVRKTMLTKPDIIKDIMKDMAYMSAFGVLTQAKHELDQSLRVTKAFSDAAIAIIKQEEEYFNVSN